jgi:hypothetical protein
VAKPFSIQSPESIAKDYGGNKQRIAQAMQLGVVDATAGVLAGMFIDRMRSAQVQEGAPQATVAQQVMGGVPAAPPPPPSGGLGATPPMAPQMQAPMAPPADAPMGMAEGGIAGLDVPSTMFDEPSNGSYSGGGLVAFAGGGMSDLYDDVEHWESRGRQSAVSPKGARGVMQLMPGTMRDPGFGVKPLQADTEEENRRVGREYLDAMHRKYGDKKLALMAYNWGPGKVDKWLTSGANPDKVPEETRKYVSNILGGKTPTAIPDRDIGNPEGQIASIEDIYSRLQERFGQSPEEKGARAKLRARAEEMASDANYEKERKADMWETLAEIGFNMASTKSPHLLQAVGEAAAAALPGARTSRKERKAIKDKGLELMVELGAADRKEAQQLWGVAVDAAKTNMSQKQFDETMRFKEKELASQVTQRGLDRQAQALVAQLSAEGKSSDAETLADALFEQYKLQAAQGKLFDSKGRAYPSNVAEAQLRAMAMQAAIAATRKTGTSGAAAIDLDGDGVPDGLGAGAQQAQTGPWAKY